MQSHDSGPKFPPSEVVISANASRKLTTEDVTTALQRHLRADWGDLASPDPVENERCLLHACHLLSAYQGINNKIKTLLRQTYGLRDERFFTLKLDSLHHSRLTLIG